MNFYNLLKKINLMALKKLIYMKTEIKITIKIEK